MQRMLALLLQILRWFLSFCENLWRKLTGNDQVIVLDTGRRIRVGKQIAEGGFSWIFEAQDVEVDGSYFGSNIRGKHSQKQRYALKRIYLADQEMVQACLKEIGIHRSVRHPNVMPLLGMSLVHDESVCYILFPLIPHSLRKEVNQRILESKQPLTLRSPWFSELDVLRLFLGIVDGVHALHEANYSHRDVKLENVLLKLESPPQQQVPTNISNINIHRYTPILTDFGSAGLKVEPVPTRRRILEIVENASQHTTMPYRPPELFDGGVRAGENESIDFTKVDVWSLGCTLFGMLYGASPFECEFRTQHKNDCPITIVECTQLRILGDIPTPPAHSIAAKWYSAEIRTLVNDMLHKDRHQRSTLQSIMSETEELIRKLGGTVRIAQEEQRRYKHNDLLSDDLDVRLISNHNFV